MAKDPAFLFYPNDWVGGTMGMSFEQKGAYIDILMMQFNSGHMTSHMVGQVAGQIWDGIKHKFKQDADGLWYNERLEHEQKARKEFTISRKNNLLGTNQYTKKVGHKDGHMTSHMEDVNEDININNKGSVFDFKKELLKYGFDENLVSEWLLIRKNKKATNTQTALNSFIQQVELTKLDKNNVLKKCVENSWKGFNHDWLKNQNNNEPKKPTFNPSKHNIITGTYDPKAKYKNQ